MIDRQKFVKEIARVVNFYSFENTSNTPDVILAEVAVAAMEAFHAATNNRETWYGRLGPGVVSSLVNDSDSTPPPRGCPVGSSGGLDR